MPAEPTPVLPDELLALYAQMWFRRPDQVQPVAAPAELQPWLEQAAVPVAVRADAVGDDVHLVARALGSARCVGLGEATHGTSEFFTFKDRLVRHLVEHEGLTAVTFEAFPAECLVVDEFLHTGEGDPTDAVRTIYGAGFPWDTCEVLDMVEWLRGHNVRTPGRPVGFYGFDIAGWSGARALGERLAELDGALATDASDALAAIGSASRVSRWRSGPAERRADTMAAIEALVAALDRRRDDFAADRDLQWRWGHARRLLEGLRVSVAMTTAPDGARRSRDQVMADNAAFLLGLEPASGRIAAWAHNAHVFRSEFFRGVPAMGVYLTELLGADYVVLGFGFDHGQFRGHDLHDGLARRLLDLAPAMEGTLDAELRQSPHPAFSLDLRAAPPQVAAYLEQPVAMRTSGAGWGIGAPEYLQQPVRPAYDLLVYVTETTASRPLPPGDVRAEPAQVTVPLDAPTNLDLREGGEQGAPAGWSLDQSAAPHDYRVDAHRGGVRLQRTCRWMTGGVVLSQTVRADAFQGRTLRVTCVVTGTWPELGSDVEVFADCRDSIDSEMPSTSEARLVDRQQQGAQVVSLDVPAQAVTVTYGVRVYGDADVTLGGFSIV